MRLGSLYMQKPLVATYIDILKRVENTNMFSKIKALRKKGGGEDFLSSVSTRRINPLLVFIFTCPYDTHTISVC